MIDRLGGALSALRMASYLRLRRKYRHARAEVRRLQNELRTTRRDLTGDLERSRNTARDERTLREAEGQRADAAEAEVVRLQAEIEIFKARDELWAKWEMRERARLDAETARMAAAKARSLELPHYEPET
jgi:hypothetical protein